MGMFDRFLKKGTSTLDSAKIVSPVTGKMIPTSEIKDAVFSQEIMGQTIGIVPSEGVVVAPVSGKVVVLFPTGHAFGILGDDGNEYLVHIGIDTVSLNGKGFKNFVKQGDIVKMGQKIVKVDLETIKNAGLDTTVMLIVTKKSQANYQVNYINPSNVIKGQKIDC